MTIRTKTLLATSALFATACSDNQPPVVLTGAQTAWFGSWEHVGSEYGNDIDGDNLLLVIHPDSSVSFKRCVNHMSSHSYVILPDAHIKSLSDRLLVIGGDILFIHMTRELPINRAPYAEGGDNYLELDGLKLRKLKPGEHSTNDSWKCGTDENTEKDSNGDKPEREQSTFRTA